MSVAKLIRQDVSCLMKAIVEAQELATLNLPAGLLAAAQEAGVDIAIVCEAALLNAIAAKTTTVPPSEDPEDDELYAGLGAIGQEVLRAGYFVSLLTPEVRKALSRHFAFGVLKSYERTR